MIALLLAAAHGQQDRPVLALTEGQQVTLDVLRRIPRAVAVTDPGVAGFVPLGPPLVVYAIASGSTDLTVQLAPDLVQTIDVRVTRDVGPLQRTVDRLTGAGATELSPLPRVHLTSPTLQLVVGAPVRLALSREGTVRASAARPVDPRLVEVELAGGEVVLTGRNPGGTLLMLQGEGPGTRGVAVLVWAEVVDPT
jgi:Flp pilus assembly secretin CpaC